jgi:queuosine precursor transporter
MFQNTRATKYYDVILASFVAFLLISNIAAVKLIEFGSIITDGGAILFPLTYIFGDVLTEVYGYKYARRAVWTAFVLMIVASITFIVVGAAPAAADWENQGAWDAILGFVPRIVIASLVAFLVGQLLNSFVLAKLKIKYGKKRLWVRLISSTAVGQFFDTTIFALIAFGGILNGTDMLRFIAIGWLFKTGVEIIMLPLTYLVINFLKKEEHKDALDKKTDFSPFHTEV